jgi:hypothetical protein
MNKSRGAQDDVDKIVMECVTKIHDSKKCLAKIIKLVYAMPNFDEYVNALVVQACKLRMDYRRHAVTRSGKSSIRASNGCRRPVVIRPVAGRDDSAEIADANTRYVHFCAGRTIKDMYGRDLLDYARGELEKGKGYILNAMLAIELKKYTPDNLKVSEVVDAKLYDKIFRAAQARTDRFMAQRDKKELPEELMPAAEPAEEMNAAAC